MRRVCVRLGTIRNALRGSIVNESLTMTKELYWLAMLHLGRCGGLKRLPLGRAAASELPGTGERAHPVYRDHGE